MTEIELILGGVLASSVGLIFFLKYLRSAKKTKLTSQEEAVVILEDEPKLKTIVTDVKSEKTQVVVEKEVEVQVEAPAPKIKKELEINKQLPQDSMLRRHYLTHLKMMLELIYAPPPTDSALKRHYQAMIAAKIEVCLNDKNKMAQLSFNYETIKATLKKKPFIAEVKPLQQETSQSDSVILPEDSMQRRHYLTNVRSIIESNHTSCPIDSALKRHYETMIDTEIEAYLLEIAA